MGLQHWLTVGVVALAASAQLAFAQAAAKLPHVRVLATGGTISGAQAKPGDSG